MKKLRIVEGVSGVYFYHLSREGEVGAICGDNGVMSTQIPLWAWGYRGHLREKYCTACERIWKEEKGSFI